MKIPTVTKNGHSKAHEMETKYSAKKNKRILCCINIQNTIQKI